MKKRNDCSNDTVLTISENINIVNRHDDDKAAGTGSNVSISKVQRVNTTDSTHTNTNGTELEVSVNVKSTIHYDSKITATPSRYEQVAGYNSPSKHHHHHHSRPRPSILRTITNTPSEMTEYNEANQSNGSVHSEMTDSNIDNSNHHHHAHANNTSAYIMRLCSSEPPPPISTQREHHQFVHIPNITPSNVTVECNVTNVTNVDNTILAELSTTTTTTSNIAGSPATATTTVSMSSPPKYPPPQLAIYHLYPNGNPNKIQKSVPRPFPLQPVVPRSQSLSFNERHQMKEITDQNQNRSSFSNSESQSRRIMLMEDDDQSDDSSDDGIAIIHPEIEGHRSDEHQGRKVPIPNFNDNVRRSASMQNVLQSDRHHHHHREPGAIIPERSHSARNTNNRTNLSVDFNLSRAHKADSLPVSFSANASRWRPRNIMISNINPVIEHSPEYINGPRWMRNGDKAESTSPIKIKWPSGHDFDYAHVPHVMPPGYDPSMKRLSWSMETDMKVPLNWLMHRRSVSRSNSKREEAKDRKRKKKKRVKSIKRSKAKERALTDHHDHRLYKRISVDSTRSTHSVQSGVTTEESPVVVIDESDGTVGTPITPHQQQRQYHPHHREVKRKRGLKRKKDHRLTSKSVGFHQTHSFSSFSEPSEVTPQTNPPNGSAGGVSHSNNHRKRRRVKSGNHKRFGLSSGMSEEMGSIDERGALMHDHDNDDSSNSSDTEEFELRDLNDDGHRQDNHRQHDRGPLTKNISMSSAPECPRSMSLNSSLSVLDGTDRAVSVDSSLGSSIQNVEKQLFETLRKLSSQQLVKSGDKGTYSALRMRDRQSMEDEEGGSESSHVHVEGQQ